MNVLTINGNTYMVQGKDISVETRNGVTQVSVGGKITSTIRDLDVKISFEGDLASIDCSNLVVKGNVTGKIDCTNLKCNDIIGPIDATNVTANNIKGNVKATNVKGNISI